MTAARVDALIGGPQFQTAQADKDAALLPILRELCQETAARCPPYRRFLDRLGGPPDAWSSPADVPPLPVSMFKRFLLSAVPPEKVVRELYSSSTTGQQPSRITIDKTTAFRQSRALVSILKEHLGTHRRPLLVFDSAASVPAGSNLTARGAAIRGVANFAAETVFGLDRDNAGELVMDADRVAAFFAKHAGRPVLLFGFTFIVWTRLVTPSEGRGVAYHVPEAVLLHTGGWKKLADAGRFQRRVYPPHGGRAGHGPAANLGFLRHGRAGRDGVCRLPGGQQARAGVRRRDSARPHSLRPVEPGQSGIIEVLSVLPSSYPGHALLTEDQGTLLGVDDCPCGRKGKYFRFTSRIQRAEIRGCGDTFAQPRELRAK